MRVNKQEPKRNTSIIKTLNINIKKMQNKILCQNSKLRTIHPSRRRIFALKAKVQRCPNGTLYTSTCSCDGEGANVRRRDDEAQRCESKKVQRCEGEGAILLSLLRLRNFALSLSQDLINAFGRFMCVKFFTLKR